MNQAMHARTLARPIAGGFAPPSTWRVVIADDEALPAELLRRTLVRLGHTVVGSAQNGSELLQLARQERPDVVVMDLRMPEMDGWTAMAALTRELSLPIIVVSALDDRESLEQAVSAGASAFLTKPVRADDLERALELAVARARDLDEIRRAARELDVLQTQLTHAARRAAVSSLAFNITHEMNNALTPIIGNAQILGLSYEADADAMERVNQIVQSARHIAEWVAWLQQLIAGDEQTRITFSLNGVVRDVMALYGERFQRLGLEVTLDLDKTLPPVQGYPSHLQQVWMTLVQNAVEGLHSGGTLRAMTRYLPEQRTVTATLTDSGSGIAPEELSHIFDADYEPRRVEGSGSRLDWGMFAVQQIIHAHGGTIVLMSPPDEQPGGTCVRITLPLRNISE